MEAHFPGRCGICGRKFPIGTHITQSKGGNWRHAGTCPGVTPTEEAPHEHSQGQGDRRRDPGDAVDQSLE